MAKQNQGNSGGTPQLYILLWMSFLIVVISNAQISAESEKEFAKSYLAKYGYGNELSLNPLSLDGTSGDSYFSESIKKFQRFFHLRETGELDEATKKVMTTPRCGNKDFHSKSSSRHKRFALMGTKWGTKKLTYSIRNYPSNFYDFPYPNYPNYYVKVPNKAVHKEIKRAFNAWSSVADLTFIKKNRGPVDIEIYFGKRRHGNCFDPFDGRGNTLAHAIGPGPGLGGDVHFDDDEIFTLNPHPAGVTLFQVAAHEIGHSLGLDHSGKRHSLMFPTYQSDLNHYSPLHPDDIYGIRRLYGPKRQGYYPNLHVQNMPGGETSSENTTTTLIHEETSTFYPDEINVTTNEITVIRNAPDLCTSENIDTIFSDPNGDIYVLKDDRYWKLLDNGVDEDYPKLISENWPGLPSNIDAAFTLSLNNKTYFFKGDQYWKYEGNKPHGVNPKSISEGFTGIPNNIDAALVKSATGQIYFFKGSEFWKYDMEEDPQIESSYPKPISTLRGIPNNLDAAFEYKNGHTYFFKKGEYWRSDKESFQVSEAEPAYPRSAALSWFGCDSSNEDTSNNV